MKVLMAFCLDILLKTYFFPSVALIIISYVYLNRVYIFNKLKKKKFDNIFSLDKSLENEINNFRTQQTKLIFHFIKLLNDGLKYKYMYISSQNKFLDIEEKDLIIDYKDNEYPYKYNITETLILLDNNNNQKQFLITINKYVENHYNIIIDVFENAKTFSLETIIYSKIRKCLKEIEKLDNIKIYIKENFLPNILRFNIVNAREQDLLYIYSLYMEEDEKSKIDKNIFSEFNENLLLNIIYSKNEKIAFRRIFENKEENVLLNFTSDEINLLEELYKKIIQKYIDVDVHNILNLEKFKNEFNLFDKAHGYFSELDENNREISIKSDLRTIDIKFKYTPFYLRSYSKNDISAKDLKLTEYLCYLNLILNDINYFLDRLKSLNMQKNLIFNKYFTLSNKDKSLILINLLTNQKKDKANYEFRSFYELPKNCPYIQSELFFRKTVSKLHDNSSLSFFYLQLNSGSGMDYLTKAEHYKIKMIPLLEIKYHLLKEFFYPYFFVYNSNNKIMASNNINTQILSFNESKEIGYTESSSLSVIPDENNMIKLAFLKFHEKAHIKFKGNYGDKLDPRYFLDYDFQLIDNKTENKNDKNNEVSLAGESGKAFEFFVFNDYSTLDKLIKSKKNLSSLNNINLLIQENFDEIRELVKDLTKDVELTFSYDRTNELSKRYEEKIKKYDNLKNKKISEIRLYDLDIEEVYKENYS